MSITKRTSKNGVTSYRVSVYDPLTQRTKWIGTYDDELAAEQAELDARKRARAGLAPTSDENPKIEDIAQRWLGFANRPRTREDYENSSRFFLEYFGQRRIRTVKPEDFHRFVAYIKRQRKRDGKPYAARTIRKTVTQLYQLINFAVEMQYIDRSPAPKMKRLALPPEPPPHKVRLSSEQAKRLIQSAPEGWEVFFATALATGTRRNELFNACYRSIDWNQGTIAIVDEHQDGSGGVTKTTAAIRTVPLSKGVLARLRQQMLEREAGPDDLIFPNQLGTRMSYPNFYRRIWIPTAQKAGMPGLRLHDLRKAYASHLAASGRTPSYLEEVMGHRSYSTTMKYYTKTPEEEADRARRDLDDWLGEENGDTHIVVAA